MGMRLRKFSHQRLKGIEAFKLHVGENRVIYQNDVEKNEILLIATGHRREVYKKSMS
jgi:mRNA-degrading endonuclease RelE of RelBE toxin-antitoxin system